MTFLEKNNKFNSYLIILLWLFILVFFTRTQITAFQENSETKEIKQIELDNIREKHKKLNKQSEELVNDTTIVEKYLVTINEDELVDYIYWYIEILNRGSDITYINSLSVSEWKKSEIGFLESKISLNLNVPSEIKLKTILNFLTKQDSKYNFYIESFNYPKVDPSRSFNINIPLKVLYK